MEVRERQIIATLLSKEEEITNKFHQAINLAMRVGVQTERGNEAICELIGSVQYTLDELVRVLDLDIKDKS